MYTMNGYSWLIFDKFSDLTIVLPFSASVLTIPARIFPIYFPVGNLSTGFLVIFSLIAGIVGMATSATGYLNVTDGKTQNLHAAAASSLVTLFLTFLAMGWEWDLSPSSHTYIYNFLCRVKNKRIWVLSIKWSLQYDLCSCRLACKEINIGWIDANLVSDRTS